MPSERDKEIRDEGIYLLISKRDHVISHVLVRERLADVLPIGKRDAIRDAFVEEFKKDGGYDAGLLSGSRAIAEGLGRSFGPRGRLAAWRRRGAGAAPSRRRTSAGGPFHPGHVSHDRRWGFSACCSCSG